MRNYLKTHPVILGSDGDDDDMVVVVFVLVGEQNNT